MLTPNFHKFNDIFEVIPTLNEGPPSIIVL